ncbi:hypothetical protein AVEN_4718-1 [Araneus ventricosus]|uniref:Uncharacterized protein n=1 Tax=Araneus ventricosus TaxID=182803 RepID=A0A4Y2VPW3_ARAVE|nr:hypothetical protein AVEN_4718-1 [Araneus ventricosus]
MRRLPLLRGQGSSSELGPNSHNTFTLSENSISSKPGVNFHSQKQNGVVSFFTEIPGGRHLRLSDQLSTEKGTTFFLKHLPRRPKPPESGFCRTGDLRRNRAHRVKLGQIKRRISESTPFCKSNRHTRENIEPQLLRTSRQDHHTWRNLFIE